MIHSPRQLWNVDNTSRLSSVLSPHVNRQRSEIKQEHSEHSSPNVNSPRIDNLGHSDSSSSIVRRNSNRKDKKGKKSKSRHKKLRSKKPKKDLSINPLYLSRVSEMLSDINVPTSTVKASKVELRKLQTRISNQIFALREEKISALQRLNRVTDKKNKAIQMIKSYSGLQETSEMEGQIENDSHLQYSLSKQHYEHSLIQKESSRLLKKNPELIQSKISQEKAIFQQAASQAERIRQQLMSPLIEHPLIIRNRQLREQLEEIRDQLSKSGLNRSNVDANISSYKEQNARIEKQLEEQRSRLKHIQKNRFETFLPQDRQKINKMNELTQVQRKLMQRRDQLQRELMDGTIIRKAEDQIRIQELQRENMELQAGCDRLLAMRGGDSELQRLSVQELERKVEEEERAKRIFNQNLIAFRRNIHELQMENEQLSRA